MIAGSVPIVLLFALSRWGSYIGVGPIYITDVLLAIAFFHWFAGFAVLGRGPVKIGPAAILGVLFGYAVLRFMLGGSLEMIALRDSVPYFYALVGVLSAWSYARSGPGDRAKTVKWLRIALVLHLFWALPSIFLGDAMRGPTLSGTAYVFQIRSDIDAALAAILAGHSLLHVMLYRRQRILNFLLLAASLVFIFSVPNRSALLSLASVMVLVLVAYYVSDRARHGKLMIVAAAPLAFISLLMWLPTTTVGARLLGTFGVAASPLQASARGTTRARVEAWEMLTEYWVADPSRFWFGVGFGPDFLTASGADVLLGSETYEDVRSPHNYLIGTALRMGFFGLAIALILFCALFVAIWAMRRRYTDDPLMLINALTVVSLTPAAMVGVIYEAPFGAVPFFWVSGMILYAAHRQKLELRADRNKPVDRTVPPKRDRLGLTGSRVGPRSHHE